MERPVFSSICGATSLIFVESMMVASPPVSARRASSSVVGSEGSDARIRRMRRGFTFFSRISSTSSLEVSR